MGALKLTELALVPAWLAELIKNQEQPVARKVTAEDWQRTIHEGSRNTELARRAGSLFARGLPESEVYGFLNYWNAEHCRPPLDPDEVNAVVRSIAGYHRDGLPRVQISGDLADMSSQVLEILADQGEPFRLYQRAGMFVRISTDDSARPFIQNLSLDALRGVIARMMIFERIERDGDGNIINIQTVHPPVPVVKDVMALPDWPVPTLLGISESPIFGADGSLNTAPGYHRGSRVYFHSRRTLDIPQIPAKPTKKQVWKARKFLTDELLGDFPFANDSDRTHAICAMILPLVREMVAGNTPLHLIEAPTAGTGKSLLADAITIPATGRSATIMTEAHNEEEWRKRITSALTDAPTFLMLDNIRRNLDSAALAAVLTTQTWSDRILGRTEMVRLPVKCVWLASGNNPMLTTEIARRTVRIRLESTESRPWERTGFKHENLREWAMNNRAKLLWCLLTIVRSWLANGRPKGSKTLGNFERWAEIIGGIVENAGFKGFLANLDEMYNRADEETAEWEDFVSHWWHHHQRNPVGIRELFEIVNRFDLMLPTRGAGNENSQKTRMGRALSQNADRRFGDFTIRRSKKRGPGASLMYYLQQD